MRQKLLLPTGLTARASVMAPYWVTVGLWVLLFVIGTAVVAVVDGAKNDPSFFGFTPKTRLTWVNGIGYNTGHMELEAPKIARFFGGKKVEFYHNPTQMVDEQDTRGYFSDLTQAGQQKYLGRITSEVNGLVEHLRKAVRSVEGRRKNGIVVHIAHSQGALVTCLAAKQLTPLEMSHIEVISFGGATPVRSTPETPFRRCVNYYSINDPLLFLNPSAESALRSGFNYNSFTSNEDEFCFLAPRIGDPIADHMLLGPTYASALEWEGRRYERKYQSYSRRVVRFTLLSILAIMSTIVQLLVLLCRRVVSAVLELRVRLHRTLVRTLVANVLAIRSFLLILFTRIIAGIRGLRHLSEGTTGSTINREKIINGASSSEAAESIFVPEAPIAVTGINSASTTSTQALASTTKSIMKSKSFLGFRWHKEETIIPATIIESANETSPRTPPTDRKARWIASKTRSNNDEQE
mmetsp:Transcript_27338/g.60374  ORF Transcript_27338/g.60374 Transcript_27338/m.60374 type:complete len:465 (-) Transcript_27338:1545-2939(-)